MKPTNFHPIEEVSKGQLSHKARVNELIAQASSKGLKLQGTSFGVGYFIFHPDGKRERFTSFAKLITFIDTYQAPVAA